MNTLQSVLRGMLSLLKTGAFHAWRGLRWYVKAVRDQPKLLGKLILGGFGPLVLCFGCMVVFAVLPSPDLADSVSEAQRTATRTQVESTPAATATLEPAATAMAVPAADTLTPSPLPATETPSPSPTATATRTRTATPTSTHTPTSVPTQTSTETPAAVPTLTSAPTVAPTQTPAATPTDAPAATATDFPTAVPTQEPTPVPTQEPTLVPTEPAPAPGNVVISFILYDGQVSQVESDEYAVIQNNGGSPVNLSGWRLNAGADGQDYGFPGIDLAPGQSCRVYTNEIHPDSCGGASFGSGQALWNNGGDCGHLFNAEGVEVSTYCY